MPLSTRFAPSCPAPPASTRPVRPTSTVPPPPPPPRQVLLATRMTLQLHAVAAPSSCALFVASTLPTRWARSSLLTLHAPVRAPPPCSAAAACLPCLIRSLLYLPSSRRPAVLFHVRHGAAPAVRSRAVGTGRATRDGPRRLSSRRPLHQAGAPQLSPPASPLGQHVPVRLCVALQAQEPCGSDVAVFAHTSSPLSGDTRGCACCCCWTWT